MFCKIYVQLTMTNKSCWALYHYLPLNNGPKKKGNLVHIAPAYARSVEGLDRFGSYVHIDPFFYVPIVFYCSIQLKNSPLFATWKG
jgi:hypothetical protein